MIDNSSPELEALRRAGVEAYRRHAVVEGRRAFEQVLQQRPTDAVSLFHLSLILQSQGEAEPALKLLKAAASADQLYATTKGVGFYLAMRRHVREGSPFEDGWLSFLELALLSGILPQNTLAGLAALPANAPGIGIPRRILQYWDKAVPPDEVSLLMQRCRAANPDYEHALFSDDAAQDFLATEYGTRIVDIYRGCFHVAAKADFFRLAYLYRHGGFYVDADEVCDRSLDPFLQTGGIEEIYTFSRGLPSCINNWFIGTVSGTRIVERAFNYCIQNIDSTMRHGRKSGVWVLTGPGALSFAILDLFCEPEQYFGGNPFQKTVFLEESEYRRIFTAPPMEYKASKEGNWRLI
ncbi:glycosyltransferase [Lichenicola sp.]|uniref:glycosyltransferase n=1 Tax=Lichenicola sp. TaxID=2804529 RepID=UPI003B001E48